MDSFDLESTLKTLAEAKVKLAIRREQNLAQDQSLKGLKQENRQLAQLIDEMSSENQSLAERIGQLTAARSLSKHRSFPSPEAPLSSDQPLIDERWSALVKDWRPDLAKKMCRKGVPAALRHAVWKLAIGNELRLTHQLYYILVNRTKAAQEVGSDVGRETLRDVYRVLSVIPT